MTAPSRTEPRIVIIGAGPTGLGAGYRLQQLGHEDWVILEATDRVGGLATSFTDEAGFTYDIGGHVMFSHYDYYDDLVDKLMGGDYTELQREAWVWMEDRFIPYPFQNNIRDLEPATVFDCVNGLIKAQRENKPFSNFKEWVDSVFGAGIAEHFMIPYNFKVWATPAELMNHVWIGERVSVVDVETILRNVLLREDQVSWGPNNTFKYPLYGGTGGLFERIVPYIKDHLVLNSPAASVDAEAKTVTFADGRVESYDVLMTTLPMDKFAHLTRGLPDGVVDETKRLRHSGSFIVGVRVDRPAETSKCWMYFPETDAPFYRVTYLSNYSPEVVPDHTRQHSLLAEISHSEFKPENRDTIIDQTLEGMVNTRLLTEDDVRDRVVDTFVIERDYTYPTPSLERDGVLRAVHPALHERGIFSRGRFGAWRYEVGNMDHSVAQGVEWANRVVQGAVDDELTYQAKRGC